MLRRSAVDSIGVPTLDRLNRLHDGGAVGTIPVPGLGAAPAPARVEHHYHQQVDVHAGTVIAESNLVDKVYEGLLKLRRRNGELGLA